MHQIIMFLMLIPFASNLFAADVPVKKQLVILTWDEYLDPAVVTQFEKTFNIDVLQVFFQSEGQRDVQLSQDINRYDLVLISEAYIQQYQKLGWLQPFDTKQLTILPHLNPLFSLYQNKAIPYAWGTTGIAFHRDKLSAPIQAWADIFNPPAEWMGKIMMMDDPMELFGAALMAAGYAIDDYSPLALQAAYEALVKQRPWVEYGNYNLHKPNKFVTGEYWISQMFSGDALYMKQHFQQPIEYVLPKEGCSLWVDYWVLMREATHVSEALQFINFIHQPENAAANVMYTYFPSVNKDSFRHLPEALQSNPLVYPTAQNLSKCQHYTLPDATQRKWINQHYFKLRRM